jgi:hypothetical protein
MTQERDIELVLEHWFTEGPTSMPSRFLDDTLERIERAPRRRVAGLGRRFVAGRPIHRLVAAAAVVLVVVGAGAVLLDRNDGVGRPSAESGAVPPEIRADWHPVGTHLAPTRSGTDNLRWDIVFDQTSLTIQDRVDVHSSAILVGPGRLELRMLDVAEYWDCQVGDTGTYTFGLSSDRQRLTLTPLGDACADRATVLSGDWSRTDLGVLQPGRHDATRFRPFAFGATGRLTYTVPTGWVGTSMNDGLFVLGKPGIVDNAEVSLISNAYASDQVAPCSENRGAAGIGRTPAALAEWLRTIPGLSVSTPVPTTIGGLSGLMVDLAVAPGQGPACAPGLYTFSLSGSDDGGWSSRLSLSGTERARYVLLDRGDGTSLVIEIHAPSSDWDAFLADADVVVNGLQFTR